MKVIVNKPVPAPVPPTTYDLLGLSESQMALLRNLLEVSTGADDSKAGCKGDEGYAVYDAIADALSK